MLFRSAKRKRVIFAYMLDSRRENSWFFVLIGGFAKRKRVIFGLNGGFEKTHDFRVKWGIFVEKTRVFHINGGFEKRKFVIFA